jgi:hypothetical protein
MLLNGPGLRHSLFNFLPQSMDWDPLLQYQPRRGVQTAGSEQPVGSSEVQIAGSEHPFLVRADNFNQQLVINYIYKKYSSVNYCLKHKFW